MTREIKLRSKEFGSFQSLALSICDVFLPCPYFHKAFSNSASSTFAPPTPNFFFFSGTMAKISLAIGLRTLFTALGTLMVSTLIYTVFKDGLPFRKELLTPWMAATLIDFYINVAALAIWVAYKESKWISSILWIIFLIGLGSITTCAYIVVQFSKLSSQESSQDPMYYILLKHPNKNGEEAGQKRKQHSFVVTLRILFTVLGSFMLGTLLYTLITDGSPFRMALLTPWMAATLVDFYINVVALAVWVAYTECSWISAVFWMVLLISFGSITTSIYIVWNLFQITCQDPVYLILVRRCGDRAENKYNRLSGEAT